ncbi:hypothetical protein [Deinococcus petrolearius]|uniref:Uncharacterized protein n=1 Tax=Deinococcus petrolearius TaxID=1751295 RepID=A0ABW1DP49_9DEIO
MRDRLCLLIRTDTEGHVRRHSATSIPDARHLFSGELARLEAEGYAVQVSVNPDQCLQPATALLTHPHRPGHAVMLSTRAASEHDYSALVRDPVRRLCEQPATTVERGEVLHLVPALSLCAAQHVEFTLRRHQWRETLAVRVAAALLEDWCATSVWKEAENGPA